MHKDKSWITGNSNIDGQKEIDKPCQHTSITLVGICKARKCKCPSPDCLVLDDDMPDCNELDIVKVCDACGDEMGY